MEGKEWAVGHKEIVETQSRGLNLRKFFHPPKMCQITNPIVSTRREGSQDSDLAAKVKNFMRLSHPYPVWKAKALKEKIRFN